MADYGTTYPGGATDTFGYDETAQVMTTLPYFDPLYFMGGSTTTELEALLMTIRTWTSYSIVLLDAVTDSAIVHDRPGTVPLGYISGTILEDLLPVQRLVQAFKRSNGAFLGQTFSSPLNGVFNIQLADGVYLDEVIVIAQGGTPNQNAIVVDRVIPGFTGGLPQ